MARIYPFQPYRYSARAGELQNLVTQPYDKITPEMSRRYHQRSPYNLVRVILGGHRAEDTPSDNAYTRAAGHLREWIAQGILERDAEPGIFPYFQEFTHPDTGERLTRKGFIALGVVEEYSAKVVHRHEQTLSGPKKDRLELLRATHAHFGQIFMLYPDEAGMIDALLDEAVAGRPLADLNDEYGARHRMWKTGAAERIQELMSDKKLIIADGHHRYETALAFRQENPGLAGADRVMMTFVNMHSQGLAILATHRLVNGLRPETMPEGFLKAAEAAGFEVIEIDSLKTLQLYWRKRWELTIIGVAIGKRLFVLQHKEAQEAVDVQILHEELLGKGLGIGEEAVREEKNLRYVRGLEAAAEEARQGAAQVALLMKPTEIEQVAQTSFGGGVMPQKSTDFFPKLLSGMTIYKLD